MASKTERKNWTDWRDITLESEVILPHSLRGHVIRQKQHERGQVRQDRWKDRQEKDKQCKRQITGTVLDPQIPLNIRKSHSKCLDFPNKTKEILFFVFIAPLADH